MHAPQPYARSAQPLPCRRHRKIRCRTCGLHLDLCVCPWLPALRLPFDIWLIQHAAEQDRPTNSGRILLGMLPGSRLLPYGARDVPFDPGPLEEAIPHAVVLFPAPDAPRLDPDALRPAGTRRKILILLDATWAQASRLRQRLPVLHRVPCRRLPDGPPGRWKIRCTSADGRLCTLEAGIRAIRLSRHPGAADRMDLAQDLIMQRMLFMKGHSAAPAPVPLGLATPQRHPDPPPRDRHIPTVP